MVIVVPTLTCSQNSYPPNVYAVVVGLIVFVAEPWKVTYKIEKQRHLLNDDCRCQTGECNSPTETEKKEDSEADADRHDQRVRTLPLSTLFQEFVNGVDQ